MSTVYLNSYYPLCSTKAGRKAVLDFGFPAYIDGSCRREPDFENEFPCISSLCRPGFAEKLELDDLIVYVTNKRGIGSRNIVAVLKVIEEFENHRKAANSYLAANKSIPNNIMVDETNTLPLNKTHQKMGWDSWIRERRSLLDWDNSYAKRAENNKIVKKCEIIYKELHRPLKLDQTKFNRKLIAQNPPILTNEEWGEIKKLIGI
jgi:hypothetical protein